MAEGILEEQDNKSTLEIFRHMSKNKTYIFLVLALSCVYFETTNIQFWIADYLMNINNAPYDLIVKMFTLVSITGPIIGAIFSGYIGTKIGGYSSVYALPLGILGSFIVIAASIPIPLISNNYLIFGCIWVMFFMGGIIVPLLTGIMLSVVEPENRPMANSLANTMYNLLGFFPAPFVYGWICDNTGGSLSKWGMIVSLAMGIPSSLFLMASFVYKPD